MFINNSKCLLGADVLDWDPYINGDCKMGLFSKGIDFERTGW